MPELPPLRLEFHVDDSGRLAVEKIEGSLVSLGDRMDKVAQRAKHLQANMSRVSAVLTRVRSLVFSLRGAFVGLSAAIVLRSAIKQISAFNTATTDMGRVTRREFRLIRNEIMALNAELGAPVELMRAYYQAISAGFTETADALNVVTVSSKAAKAAHFDQAQTIRALSGFMAGYRGEIESVSKAADLLFMIEEKGRTTFAELIPVIGDLSAISRTFGVSAEEMAGALAQVTQTAGSTAEAATQYRAMLIAMAKPTEDMIAKLGELKTASMEELVAQYGLIGALEKLIERTDGSAQAIARLFSRVNAQQGVIALMADNFDQARDRIEAMGDVAGATERYFEQWKETLGGKWEIIHNEIKKIIIALGLVSETDMGGLLDEVQSVVINMRLWVEANKELIGQKIGQLFYLLGSGLEWMRENWDDVVFAAKAFLALKLIAYMSSFHLVTMASIASMGVLRASIASVAGGLSALGLANPYVAIAAAAAALWYWQSKLAEKDVEAAQRLLSIKETAAIMFQDMTKGWIMIKDVAVITAQYIWQYYVGFRNDMIGLWNRMMETMSKAPKMGWLRSLMMDLWPEPEGPIRDYVETINAIEKEYQEKRKTLIDKYDKEREDLYKKMGQTRLSAAEEETAAMIAERQAQIGLNAAVEAFQARQSDSLAISSQVLIANAQLREEMNRLTASHESNIEQMKIRLKMLTEETGLRERYDRERKLLNLEKERLGIELENNSQALDRIKLQGEIEVNALKLNQLNEAEELELAVLRKVREEILALAEKQRGVEEARLALVHESTSIERRAAFGLGNRLDDFRRQYELQEASLEAQLALSREQMRYASDLDTILQIETEIVRKEEELLNLRRIRFVEESRARAMMLEDYRQQFQSLRRDVELIGTPDQDIGRASELLYKAFEEGILGDPNKQLDTIYKYYDTRVSLERAHQEELAAIREDANATMLDQEAVLLRQQKEMEELNWKGRMEIAESSASILSNIFASLYLLGNRENKKLFRAYQAFAIAEAIVATYTAANKAYATAPHPILGAAMAALAVAAGMTRVALIKAQTFHTGGLVDADGKRQGLAADERLAVLQTGEFVLSREQVAMLRADPPVVNVTLPEFHLGGLADTSDRYRQTSFHPKEFLALLQRGERVLNVRETKRYEEEKQLTGIPQRVKVPPEKERPAVFQDPDSMEAFLRSNRGRAAIVAVMSEEKGFRMRGGEWQ